ncbi:pseudouridylate synthase [Weissella oryzae SG25]|uniref:tRNA pseudouridine synthase B n=1 Tax=Weissella oryzae (strain DSM 25784 / JCM 18191 / LMG 30913 / SG25) TaxID=1329250 RepID=A0A069CV35_WEIOS|nr:tRNA pseudouridine(55) synthase TruB [Weissella oryzae]GAK31247.1 pseudouridylate synthase [Weissella oryzae SG25]
MDGILPVYKEVGMTSHDVVFKLRKILHMKKIGHAGTLDPNVDGVLPIALGKATKTIEFLQSAGKVYTGEVTLGFATTTEDLDGEVIEKTPLAKPFSDAELMQAMAQLTGAITQIPPMYSAVKVNGRRLYEYARAGESVERPVRQAMIYRFERLTDSKFDAAEGLQKFRFEAAVSKGTYIRTLAVDLGKSLGVAAVMSQLTRQAAGGFVLSETHSLSEIAEQMTATDDLGDWLKPLGTALVDLPQYALSASEFAKVQQGVGLPATINPGLVDQLVLTYQGATKSVYTWNADKELYRPYRQLDLD